MVIIPISYWIRKRGGTIGFKVPGSLCDVVVPLALQIASSTLRKVDCAARSVNANLPRTPSVILTFHLLSDIPNPDRGYPAHHGARALEF